MKPTSNGLIFYRIYGRILCSTKEIHFAWMDKMKLHGIKVVYEENTIIRYRKYCTISCDVLCKFETGLLIIDIDTCLLWEVICMSKLFMSMFRLLLNLKN